MKKILAVLLITTVMLLPISACSKKGSGTFVKANIDFDVTTTKETVEVLPSEVLPSEVIDVIETTEMPIDIANKEVIDIWAFNNDMVLMADKFKELHPDFGYDFNFTLIATDYGWYEEALDNALCVGGDDAPDIFVTESAFVTKYTQGIMSSYACAYEDLGIDVNSGIEDAEIAQYSVDVGTRPSDNKIVGLSYESSAGVMIYRASIAEATWGTSDPEDIKDIVGGGSGNWKKFWVAAEDLKAKGYSIVSGDGDMWRPVKGGATTSWVVDGKLNIPQECENFLDISMTLMENGYHNDTKDWLDMWFADMNGTGNTEVFAFFGPSWFLSYIMGQQGYATAGDWRVTESPVGFFWGGNWVLASTYATQASEEKQAAIAEFIEWVTLDYSETGLQYLLANSELDDTWAREAVVSSKVMEISDGSLDYLGGQNMFDYFIVANSNTTGTAFTEYDAEIDELWRDQVRLYTSGEKSKKDAIADFKYEVEINLLIPSD